jgi:hypothetical protein
VDHIPLFAQAGDRRALQQIAALHGPPAFAVRALRVKEAFDSLVARCLQQRQELLGMARIRLGTLHALAGTWTALESLLQDVGQLDALQQLEAELRPELRLLPKPTSSLRVLRRAVQELADSLDRFNRRWQEYLKGVDLSGINALRDGYNKYYVLEKECLLGSPRLARQGFRPLPPATTADLADQFPPLPIPRIGS